MKLYNSEAEQQAILSLLQSSSEVKVELLGRLTETHFGYTAANAAIGIILKQVESGDVVMPTLETFEHNPAVDDQVRLVLNAPTVRPITNVEDAKHLVHVLEYYRKIRRIYEGERTTTAQLKGDKEVDLDRVISDMEQTLLDVRGGFEESKMFHAGKGHSQEADKVVEEILSSSKPKLIPSTFKNFDKRVGGFGQIDLVIYASHEKGGKSITALNTLLRQYLDHNLDVCYIPLEMNVEETYQRILSHISGVPHERIRQKILTSTEKVKIDEAWTRFKEHGQYNSCRFTIWETIVTSPLEIRLRFKPLKFNVICCDYINLMESDVKNQQDWQMLSTIAKDMKRAAKDLQCLILLPTQMNRDGDIRYAKALKEHANTVWTWFYEEEQKATHIIKVKQLAVRGWAPFDFNLYEDFEHMTITDFDGPDPYAKSETEELDKMGD